MGPIFPQLLIQCEKINICLLTLYELFRYLYTDEVEVDLETAIALLPVARRFKVNHLVQLCLCLLNEEVDNDNVCYLLDQAIQSHALSMRDRALEIISKSTRACLKSDSFLRVSLDALDHLLQSNELNISEQELFECSLDWAAAQCLKKKIEPTDANMRSQLGNSLYRIRFSLMPKEYFQNNVEDRNILNEEEKAEIWEVITNGRTTNKEFKFDQHLRTTTEYFRVLRFEKLDRKLREHTGHPDAIMFEATKPVWFHGVIVYGSFIEQTLNVHLEVTDADNKVIRSLGYTFESVESEAMHEILLPTPFETVPGSRYNVIVTIVGKFRHMFQGISGKSVLPFKDAEIRFFQSGNSSNGTSINEGQIPGFLLS